MTNIIMMAPSQTIIKPKILKKTGPRQFLYEKNKNYKWDDLLSQK